MTKEEATEFFAEFFLGKHHIPAKIQEYGDGFQLICTGHNLSSFDHDGLTRLVIMAHEKCIRVEIVPASPKLLRICIWKREREGSISQRHPTLDQAIENYNRRKVK